MDEQFNITPTAMQDASETMIVASQTATPEMVHNILELTTQSIYLMGASFVLGSLFTLFLLLVLDFMRRDKPGGDL